MENYNREMMSVCLYVCVSVVCVCACVCDDVTGNLLVRGGIIGTV